MKRVLAAAMLVFGALLVLPFARANPDSPGAAVVASVDPEDSAVNASVYGDGSGFGPSESVDAVHGTLAAPER